jgi:hypothetical protein
MTPFDPVGDAAEAFVNRRKELLDDLDAGLEWLNNADGPPDIKHTAMTVMWRANVLVAETGTWNNNDLSSAYTAWERLEAPEELPTEGHRDAWRYAARRVCTEAREFAELAKSDTTLDANSLFGLAAVAVDVADGLEQGRALP